jgi:hypothetical protein
MMGAVNRAELLRARSRRPRSLLALVAASGLLLSGCGDSSSDYAARINGETISQAELLEAAEQWNAVANQPVTPQAMIESVAKVPALEELIPGTPLTDEQLVGQLQGLELAEPNQVLVDFARGLIYEQNADPAQLQQALADVEVEVNPRYGAWDAATGTVVADTPEWITEDTAESTAGPGDGR